MPGRDAGPTARHWQVVTRTPKGLEPESRELCVCVSAGQKFHADIVDVSRDTVKVRFTDGAST